MPRFFTFIEKLTASQKRRLLDRQGFLTIIFQNQPPINNVVEFWRTEERLRRGNIEKHDIDIRALLPTSALKKQY